MIGMAETTTRVHTWMLLLDRGIITLMKTQPGKPPFCLLLLQGKRKKKMMVTAEMAAMAELNLYI